jgi:hypothetical protein
VTRHWSGAGRSTSASHRRPRPTPRRRVWSTSAPGCGSGIRWCVRPPTGRQRPSSGRRSTAHWPRSPIRHSIQIGGSGTWPRALQDRTRTSPKRWSAPPVMHWHGADSPRPPHSSNAPR